MLCFGYCIPFHHLPPVTLEPLEFSSCGSGSLKVQALQEEVDKLLLKDIGDCLRQGSCILQPVLYHGKSTLGVETLYSLSPDGDI